MAWRATGVQPEQLANAPKLPDDAIHVWYYFKELHQFRGSNGFGANPITPTGIKHWCWLTSTVLEDWEIRAIRAVDNAYMESQSDRLSATED